MALITYFFFKGMHNKLGNTTSRIIGGTLAEIEMILGYFVFEGFMYGFAPSVVNIPANAVQGIAGLIIGIVLVKIFEKTKMF
ncbi:MAG: ECF transporter S component [Clostridia bacterium]|nr:ECF transporter S component [Clostridia bacterium]